MPRKGRREEDREIPTESMFDVEPYRQERERPPSIPSAAQGNCPRCSRTKIGLVTAGAHLVWREHTYVTWCGSRLVCSVSGVAVCIVPEATPYLRSAPVKCPHE